ncbi:gas vesicle protein K [Streptomyces albidoflavus]|uniref:gas vesicle protein K n=1 Tax=Streptomyces albidoflavus TaxID=1886 RepID=UPI0035E24E7E
MTGTRLDIDPQQAGRDLAALVLTVVELLRQLMERQALRRLDLGDLGDLDDGQEEAIGTTLMLLDRRMDELCAQHGLRREDLNLDLGPLGTLLPDGD